jgi:hypothetical protein
MYLVLWLYTICTLCCDCILYVPCVVTVYCIYLVLWLYTVCTLHCDCILYASCVVTVYCMYLVLSNIYWHVLYPNAITVTAETGSMEWICMYVCTWWSFVMDWELTICWCHYMYLLLCCIQLACVCVFDMLYIQLSLLLYWPMECVMSDSRPSCCNLCYLVPFQMLLDIRLDCIHPSDKDCTGQVTMPIHNYSYE